ncbi:MAG TPA: YfcE family phosphodiesterase [Candidatus Acetothermia bacterium]|nr:YfcE family phosphodiesterase [Candidatus Acetothermia bacterium]
MKVGLISDSHVPTGLRQLPPALLRSLDGVDVILHAGDLVSERVLDQLQAIAPTSAVAGNMDPPEVRRRLRERETLQLAGWTIGLQHGHQPHAIQSHYIGAAYDAPEMSLFFQVMRAQLPEAQIIVFGHFHRAVVMHWEHVLFINPGAVVPTAGGSSFALLELGETAEAQIVPLGTSGA